MSIDEERLAELLKWAVPHPPRELNIGQLTTQSRGRSRASLGLSVLAGAAVLLTASAIGIVIAHYQNPAHSAITRPPSSRIGSKTRAPTATRSAAANPACQASQLKITIVSFAGWADVVGEYLGFTNNSATICELQGWPSVSGLLADGHALAAKHIVGSQDGPYITKPPLVVLRPGELAEAAVYAFDYAGPGKSTCPAPYHELLIAPPGNAQRVTISGWLPFSGRYMPSCSRLLVSPVVPPSDAPSTG